MSAADAGVALVSLPAVSASTAKMACMFVSVPFPVESGLSDVGRSCSRDQYLCSVFEEVLGCGQADAARAAGDEGAFAFETFHVITSGVIWAICGTPIRNVHLRCLSGVGRRARRPWIRGGDEVLPHSDDAPVTDFGDAGDARRHQ